MAATRDTHAVTIAGLDRELPLFEVRPGLRIAVLNILGDVALARAAAAALADRLADTAFDTIVTPETKSVPLAHELAATADRPYAVLRKSYKAYMGDALAVQTESITTGVAQHLYLDEKDAALVRGRPVLLLDDVVSTGSTLQGMRQLMRRAGADIAAVAAIATEGDPGDWRDVVALTHLPLFRDA